MKTTQADRFAQSAEITDSATTVPPVRISLPIMRSARPKPQRPILTTLKDRAAELKMGKSDRESKPERARKPRKIKLPSIGFE